ncbi:MAG: glycerol-3-phosphate dehydrogenase/oxidase [Bryobacteraceae bacterium]
MPGLRDQQIHLLTQADLDVLVVGGGINGAGVIRDLALRAQHARQPLRIGLVEQGHFGSGTSGRNSQLIHGGLRYLKYLQFQLVRESLRERTILLKIAPQFVEPLAFLLPMYGVKSRVVYGIGLRLYDELAGTHRIARHKMLSRGQAAQLEPELERASLSAAAIFWDARVHSGRFVVENVLDAIANGALASNYVKAESWVRDGDGLWRVECRDVLGQDRFQLRARKLVDARGAWIGGVTLRLVRGSHIVIPRVNAGDHAIAHFEPSGRIVFLIPWGSRNQLTLVGTTDVDHADSPDRVHIAPAERDDLIGVVRKLFPSHADVTPVSTFSSVRPLLREGSGSAMSTTREHRIWNSPDGILHIAGGKYTTYRLMSEQAADLVSREVAPPLIAIHPTSDTPFPCVERDIGDAMEQRLWDYLFVSTSLGYERSWDADSLAPFAEELGRKLGWSDARIRQEAEDTALSACASS